MIKRLAVVIGVFAMFSIFAMSIVAMHTSAAPLFMADSKSLACDGATLVTGGDCDPATGDGVSGIVDSVVTIFAWGLGILSVLFIMYGGFKYVTNGGDSNKLSSAKNTILFAIVGLVIAALAQTVVKYVIGLFN